VEVKDFDRPPKAMMEEFKKYPTSIISDALDRLGIRGGCEGIRAVVEGVKMAGPALTVYRLPVDPVNPRKGGVDLNKYAKPGDVIVIDNGGRTDCTVWGDILAMAAIDLNLAGTVIDGCCRDVDSIRKIKYPVFSVGVFMMTGKDRSQLEAVNVSVAIRNVRVNPGDIVVGDDSGVVIVPRAKAEQVLQSVQEIADKENLIKNNVKDLGLTEAREKFGYFDLQRKK